MLLLTEIWYAFQQHLFYKEEWDVIPALLCRARIILRSYYLIVSALRNITSDLIMGENVAISTLISRNSARRPSAMGVITEAYAKTPFLININFAKWSQEQNNRRIMRYIRAHICTSQAFNELINYGWKTVSARIKNTDVRAIIHDRAWIPRQFVSSQRRQ